MSGRARVAAAVAKTIGRALGIGRRGVRAVTGAPGRYRAGLRSEIGAQMNEPTLSALSRFGGRGSAGVKQLNVAPLSPREMLRAGAMPYIPKHLGADLLRPAAATAGAMVIADPVVRAGRGAADFLANPSQFTQEGFQPRKDLPRSLARRRSTPQSPRQPQAQSPRQTQAQLPRQTSPQRATSQPPPQQPGIGATVGNVFRRAKRTVMGLPEQVAAAATGVQHFDPLSPERRKALNDQARNEIVGITWDAAKDRVPGMGTNNRTDRAIYGMIRDFSWQGAGYAARQGLERGKGAYGLTLPRALRAPRGALPFALSEMAASGLRGSLGRVLPTQRPSIKTIVHAGLKAEFGPTLAEIKAAEGLKSVPVIANAIKGIVVDLAQSETLQRMSRIGGTMKGYSDDEFVQQLAGEYDLPDLLPWYQIVRDHGPTALQGAKWAYGKMVDDQ